MRDYPRVVELKDGRSVVIRPPAKADFDKLYAFFRNLEDDDRLLFRGDVTDPDLNCRWTDNLDVEHVIPVVAEDGVKIVADGTLHVAEHGWSKHIGTLRLVVARTHRDVGQGTLIARELVALAEEHRLEKIQVDLIADDELTVKKFQAMGFEKAAVIANTLQDQHGNKRDLAIMVSDVANLGRAVEDWIHDSMIPAFRVPGAGV